MTPCSHCHHEVPSDARFCPGCGAAVDPTATVREPSPSAGIDTDATSPWTPSTTPIRARSDDASSYQPGTLLDGRFRIVGALGHGGMGTVYRAEDLKLRQEVALKFLSERFARDQQAVALLINEVRVARRISHPHVCRVHDIGEIDGNTFISMEYVDGEDLSSLLRRIGRIPGDKALQIARQLCAGLHAAHERGVLHRDLKPANVMLDGDGQARITDFGIAAAMESIADEESSAGTPAYMAPELFTGAKASVQSDIYSLGLVLYELYTGQPLFRATSMTELLQHHRRPIAFPTKLTPGMDEQVEQVILSCLERQPERRPRSAMVVLARLPGGDPLAEALASGKTPSPELVAASGDVGVQRPRTAAALVVALVVGIVTLFGLERHVKLFSRTPLPKSGEVLADRAQETLSLLGYPTEDLDRIWGFELDETYLQEICDSQPTSDDWHSRLECKRPSLITFWYRGVPTPARLRPTNIKGRVSWADPAIVQPGDAQVRLDPFGRLRELLVVPESQGRDPAVQANANDTEPPATNWSALFAASELSEEEFEKVPPARIPHAFADFRAAWIGQYPEPPHHPVRVEAATLHGKVISWRIIENRWPNARQATGPSEGTKSWRFLARIGLVLATIVLAYRTLTRRRGDARGALRLGLAMFLLVTAFTVLAGDHGGDWSRIGTVLVRGMTHGLVVATEFALLYFAFEPYVRRIWPETMVSWSRLLAGRVRDPLVGHHILVGESLGVVTVLIAYLSVLVPRWVGHAEAPPLMLHPSAIVAMSGTSAAIGAILEIAVDFARGGMMFFASLVVLKLILKKPSFAAIASILIWASVWTDDAAFTSSLPWLPLAWIGNAAFATAITVFAIKVGLLGLIVGFVFYGVVTSLPLELGGSVRYGEITVLALVLVGAATLFGVRTATRVR